MRDLSWLAEQAYVDRLSLDKAVSLLRSAATGGTPAAKLEASLAGFKPSMPSMPRTAALLGSIPASSSHPGAQYRLAGDR